MVTKAHQPQPNKPYSVSLTPKTAEEVTRLRDEMRRDREAIVQRFAAEIDAAEQQLRDLDREIQALHVEIKANIAARGQMMGERGYDAAAKILQDIRALSTMLSRHQQARGEVVQELKELRARRDGLELGQE